MPPSKNGGGSKPPLAVAIILIVLLLAGVGIVAFMFLGQQPTTGSTPATSESSASVSSESATQPASNTSSEVTSSSGAASTTQAPSASSSSAASSTEPSGSSESSPAQSEQGSKYKQGVFVVEDGQAAVDSLTQTSALVQDNDDADMYTVVLKPGKVPGWNSGYHHVVIEGLAEYPDGFAMTIDAALRPADDGSTEDNSVTYKSGSLVITGHHLDDLSSIMSGAGMTQA